MSFYARHESECPACGNTIYEGDEAAYDRYYYDGEGALHEDCAIEARKERMEVLDDMINGLGDP